MRKVFCTKLKQELEGLEKAPMPGELGEQIYESISKQAWQNWLEKQTMLINEQHLSLIDPKARKYLMTEMKQYLFEDKDINPEGFVPPTEQGS